MARLFLLAALLISLTGLAQTNLTAVPSASKGVKISLTGKITDEKTGEPLAGATIYFPDDRIGAASNANGLYRIDNIPDGHHVVEVSYSGYATVVEHLELYSNTTKDFALSPVITENQAVVVTGVSSATSVRKSPIPVATLRRTDLLQNPSTNIVDALSRIPGVSQLSTGPAISKPIIRGLGYNRVVTINDGVRQEGQQWGDEHGIEIDELSIARAEVLKGPASLMYGSDAMAGVVNFITNVPVPEGTLKGNIISNYQSNNGLFGINGNLAGNKNGLNWNVYGTYKDAGNYRNKYDGRVLNSAFNEKNFGGYIGVNKSWGFSHLIVSRFDQHLGLVEGDRDDATGKFILYAGTPLEHIATDAELDERSPLIPQQHIVHYKVTSDNSFVMGKSRLKVNLAFQDNLRQEFGNPEDPSEKELFFDLKTFSYNLQWQLPEKNEWHTTIGVAGMQQGNKNKGAEALIPDYDLFDVGAFVFTQRFFKKATLSGGLRFDNRSVNGKAMDDGGTPKFDAFHRNFSNVSGSVGISYEPADFLTLKANIARGFRAPTLAELGSNGAHEGTNRYEYGDQQLSSENSWQFDAGVEVNYEHFNIGIAAFYNRINNFVFYRKLLATGGGDSTVNVDGEDITAYQFGQHNAALSGIEANFDIHPHPLDWLHFENSISFVRGKFSEEIDGTDNLPLIPATKLTSELRANFKKAGKSLSNLYFRFNAEHTFDQDKPFYGYGTETATNGYTLLNAGAGADFMSHKKTLFSLHLSLLNIADVAYQNHLSRLKYTDVNNATGRQGVFNAGRNFSIKLNIPLDFSNH